MTLKRITKKGMMHIKTVHGKENRRERNRTEGKNKQKGKNKNKCQEGSVRNKTNNLKRINNNQNQKIKSKIQK